MKHAKVGFLMTDEVVSVVGRTPSRDVARLLVEHDISGVPVVDEDDRVIGVVSQTDLHATGDLTARALMSAPAVTVHAEQTVTEAARLMTRRGVERLPVVDEEDRLVGIVTRRDLLRVFLRPDPEIRRCLIEDVLAETMGLGADAVDVHVVDGVVTLDGRLAKSSQIPVVVRLAGQLDGVVAVTDRLTARFDDSPLAPPERRTDGIPW
ncbi:CBS domain-containing protein [Streptomyces sp. NBC_00249]|uniref:CBS domain-containing protein n=1 Tax=Streptomyces sp. NBC_00249 TaxID=2975690 RepID=UPI0022559BBD|nr:CBS domain-containing protein [Streptomyces sp. NBC_00249]MCX5192356.1 CBS domain-containing protein [Streptomyces sp. NBC_00249]